MGSTVYTMKNRERCFVHIIYFITILIFLLSKTVPRQLKREKRAAAAGKKCNLNIFLPIFYLFSSLQTILVFFFLPFFPFLFAAMVGACINIETHIILVFCVYVCMYLCFLFRAKNEKHSYGNNMIKYMENILHRYSHSKLYNMLVRYNIALLEFFCPREKEHG